jgi:hypothetical protein
MYSKAVLPHTTCPLKVTQNEAFALGIPMMHHPEAKRNHLLNCGIIIDGTIC